MIKLDIPKNDNFTGLIAVLNTTPATIPMLKSEIHTHLPNANVINFLDDSILPMVKEDSSTLPYAFEKFLVFAKFAERQNAKIIINACSTVGSFKDFAKDKLSVPLIRIDDAVTDCLTKNVIRIAVLATASTTVIPSTDLVRSKAPKAIVDTFLLEEAATFNAKGDKIRHDKIIAEKINEIGSLYDSIFLAQASMADSINYAIPEYTDKMYTSIPYAIRQLVELTLR